MTSSYCCLKKSRTGNVKPGISSTGVGKLSVSDTYLANFSVEIVADMIINFKG